MALRRITYSLLVLFLSQFSAFGQGLVQCGGHIVFDNGGHVVVDGSGDYYDTLNGQITMVNAGTIWLPGDWENASGGPVFTTNDGRVSLNGGTQFIKGSSLTKFPSVAMLGSGDKYLETSTLIGGGFNSGGNGQLICSNKRLWLNNQTLTINNSATNAITQTTGGIVSETDNTLGYGTVEWVIRNNTGNYTVPFQTVLSNAIPIQFVVSSAGVSVSDSGYVSISTYPTTTNALPNNRVLPTGVTNTMNEFGRENAAKLLDRYWVMGSNGYTSEPSGNTVFGYRDSEWDGSAGSSNDIVESNLRPIPYDFVSNQWDYSRNGANNATGNRATIGLTSYRGIWTLADSTICPKALFSWEGNCVLSPIRFTDNSTITKGTIESWDWQFGDGYTSSLQNTLHMYPTAGVYPVQLKVVGNSGCPDSLEIPLTIDAKALADFTIEDDPLVDIPTQFTSLSQNATSWDWDFGDFNSDNIEHPKHTYQEEGSFDVVLIANNNANCPDTIIKSIEVNLPSLFLVPTAFSPGTKDNINTYFGLTTLQRVSEYTMTVYNRWGEQVFSSDDVSKQWDGTYLGKPVPSGSYLYIIWFRDRTMKGHALNGSVLLIR